MLKLPQKIAGALATANAPRLAAAMPPVALLVAAGPEDLAPFGRSQSASSLHARPADQSDGGNLSLTLIIPLHPAFDELSLKHGFRP
jgi:hypothetical protein